MKLSHTHKHKHIITQHMQWKLISRSYVGKLVQPHVNLCGKETTKKIRWNPKEINGITNMNYNLYSYVDLSVCVAVENYFEDYKLY